MEQDIALALLIRQRDFLGAAKYVAENTKDQAIRARRIREVIGAAREVDDAYLPELLDRYGAELGLTAPAVEVYDHGVAKAVPEESFADVGAFDGPLDVIERDILAEVSADGEDDITREWDDVPTVPMKPVTEDKS